MDNGASSYRRYLDGDEAAFDEIMEELFDNLVFFLNRYVQDIHAAEDLAIDAFSDLVVHRHRYDFRVTLKTYLFMIGRSRALNYLKRRGRLKLTALSDAEEVPDEQDSPEDTLFTDARRQALNAALAQLPEDMRVAVHLVYFEDMSYAEAARVMKKTRKQIDNLLYRAKNALRLLLGERGEELI